MAVTKRKRTPPEDVLQGDGSAAGPGAGSGWETSPISRKSSPPVGRKKIPVGAMEDAEETAAEFDYDDVVQQSFPASDPPPPKG